MADTTADEGPGGGRRFGRYRVLDVLGTGAMGEVLLAQDDLLGREVAVKTIRSQVLAAMKGNLYDERLFREARAIAVLGHPNIVRIFDMGVEDGIPFLVMEAVRGPTLKERVEQAPLGKSDLRTLGIQMARALDAAHGKGILHRDIKPSNILEAEPLTWKLADFGIAHTPDSSLTLTGQFLGTPMYSAPESILAGQFSPASDVYGLAATLYEAACGQTVLGPGSGASLSDRLTKGVRPPGEIRAGVPPEIERAIMAGLSLETSQRPTAAELAEMLARGTGRFTRQRSAASAPARPSRRALVLAGAGLFACAIAGAFYLGKSNASERADPAAAAAAAPAPPSADLPLEAPRPVPVATAPVEPKAALVEPKAALVEPEAPPPEPEAPPPEPEARAVEEPAAAPEPVPVAERQVAGLDEVKKLIAAKRRESAIDRLQELRRKYPKDAAVPFLLGSLYFEKQWWEHGFANYKVAIQNDPSYRENATLIRHAIENLKSPSQNWRGVRFLTRDIGKPAIPHLQKAASSGPGYIRKRARQVLTTLRRAR